MAILELFENNMTKNFKNSNLREFRQINDDSDIRIQTYLILKRIIYSQFEFLTVSLNLTNV